MSLLGIQVVGALVVCFLLWRLARLRKFAGASLARIAGPDRDHWLTGDFQKLFNDGLEYNLDLFRTYGSVVRVHGMLGTEQLLVADPRALYHIVVKEQDVYQETDMFLMTNKLVFGEGLISTNGAQHRKQRKMLNPVFSVANMRSLLPTIQPIADALLDRLRGELPEDGGVKEVDVLPWIARGTLEYVGRAVLGIGFDALDPSKTNEYADAIRRISHTGLKVFFLRPFVPLVVRNLSQYWRNRLVDCLQVPFPALKEIREISYTLHRCARRVFLDKKAEMRMKVGEEDADKKKDLMTIMLKANMSTSEKECLTDTELVGQINTLLLGGQETTTSALARILHILAHELEAQARLRSEVRKAKRDYAAAHGLEDEGGWARVSLPYDVLIALPFLDAVVRETFRVHPPTNMLHRSVAKDVVLPLQFPIRSTTGEEVTAIHVPAGTNIIMSILGANRCTQVWGEDASVWRPERWLTVVGERIAFGRNVDCALGEDDMDDEAGRRGREVEDTPGCRDGVRFPGVYASMMTFLGGGRACIGFKFAEMEIKQVICTLISYMHFALPSTVDDDNGAKKEIYWRMDGLQIPVVLPPHGDSQTAHVPLDIRLVKENDFLVNFEFD